SSMSHELRTPLNAIIGFSQLLENNPNEPLSEVQREHTRHVIDAGHHLLGLINDVLELSKIETGNIELSLKNIEVQEVLGAGLEMVKGQAMEKSINIVGDFADRSFPQLRTDRSRLLQVLLNLLTNAIKYNRGGGTVTVDVDDAGEEFLRITVTDTGLGIPANKQARLFEPFDRLGRESGEIEGTGIGLTITKQIMETLGGAVGFKSEVGVGSTFWIDLPLADGTESPLEEDSSEAEEISLQLRDSRSGIILCVEDNPANLALIKMVVERISDATLMPVNNAEASIRLASDVLPDVILMDINLPGMDGIEALAQLRAADRTKDIPVIAITAEAMPEEIKRLKKAGFDDYFTKPIDVQRVLKCINSYLEE
ncbi:MAG: response regulator, partial [Rhodospirillales bacterium]|nr:response regulator [Rhodospirillales bacterium]